MELLSKNFFILVLVASTLHQGNAGIYSGSGPGRLYDLVILTAPLLLKKISNFGYDSATNIPPSVVNEVGKFGKDMTVTVNNIFINGGPPVKASIFPEILTVPGLISFVLCAAAIGYTAYKIYCLYRVHEGLSNLSNGITDTVEAETELEKEALRVREILETVTRNLLRLQVNPSIPELNVLEEEIDKAENIALKAIMKGEALQLKLKGLVKEAAGYATTAQDTSNFFLAGTAGSLLAATVFGIFPAITVPVSIASGVLSYLSKAEYRKALKLIENLNQHLDVTRGFTGELKDLSREFDSIRIEIRLMKARVPIYEKILNMPLFQVSLSIVLIGVTILVVEYVKWGMKARRYQQIQ